MWPPPYMYAYLILILKYVTLSEYTNYYTHDNIEPTVCKLLRNIFTRFAKRTKKSIVPVKIISAYKIVLKYNLSLFRRLFKIYLKRKTKNNDEK